MPCTLKKPVILLLLLYMFCLVRGQNVEADSLQRLLNTTKEGPERVLILEGLSFAYVSAYPDTAMYYALQGLELARKINYAIGEAYCTNALGNVYFSVGDYPKALEMYLSSLKMKEGIKNQQHAIAVTYFNIANVYTEQEDYRHALDYVFKAKQADEAIKDSASILFDLHSLSSIYLRMKNTDSALYYVKDAVDLAGRLGDKNMIGAILNNYGEIHAYLKNFDLASKYYHLSIFYVLAINDNEVLASDYYGLAKIFSEQGLTDSSVFYARKSLSVAREAPFLKQLLDASSFLTNLYRSAKRYDSAFLYQELSTATKDSLYNVEKIKKVQNLKLLEQQRQQSITVDRIRYRNRIRLYAVIFASGVFLLIAVLLWRNNKQRQRAYALLQKQTAKTEQALHELRSTQDQLIQKEKMASLGELTAGIAHEIKNPLNFINNFSDVNVELLDELKAERHKEQRDIAAEDNLHEEIKKNAEKIVHHGKRADSIVKSMLEHSRTSKEAGKPVDINALVSENFKLAWHSMRAKDKSFNADMKMHLDESLEKIAVIKQDIARVLINLFNNAFYAVNERKKNAPGLVKGEQYEPMVSVSTKLLKSSSGGSGILIIVRDNGNGIPQRLVDKIFQPFFTTKPAGQATGLGLSLSYDIVTKGHGGSLSVNTMEGEYAEFVVELPG